MCVVLFVTAPGGSLVEDSDPDKVIRTNTCVFSCDETVESLRSFYEVHLFCGRKNLFYVENTNIHLK